MYCIALVPFDADHDEAMFPESSLHLVEAVLGLYDTDPNDPDDQFSAVIRFDQRVQKRGAVTAAECLGAPWRLDPQMVSDPREDGKW